MLARLFPLAVVIGLLAGAFLILSPRSPGWEVRADAPLVIGGYGDNFSYSGKGVRPLSGSLSFTYGPEVHTGVISVTLATTAESGTLQLGAGGALSGEIKLSGRITPTDRIVADTDIHGDTGLWGPELPRVHAILAGTGTFDLLVDGKPVYTDMVGEWSLEQALHRPDGSIRKSGLYYSPLLRDKTGFADPDRLEFDLIVHSPDVDQGNNPPYTIVLHLVFTHVAIEHRPAD